MGFAARADRTSRIAGICHRFRACIVLQAVRAGIENTWWSDAALLLVGLALQLGLALALDRQKPTKSAKNAGSHRPAVLASLKSEIPA